MVPSCPYSVCSFPRQAWTMYDFPGRGNQVSCSLSEKSLVA
jgi:hypothetical protein